MGLKLGAGVLFLVCDLVFIVDPADVLIYRLCRVFFTFDFN
jgi:hypothetical protein